MLSDEKRRQDALRLAAETGADPRTAARFLDGKPVQRVTAQALRGAAVRLGIEVAAPAVDEENDA